MKTKEINGKTEHFLEDGIDVEYANSSRWIAHIGELGDLVLQTSVSVGTLSEIRDAMPMLNLDTVDVNNIESIAEKIKQDIISTICAYLDSYKDNKDS